MLASYKHDASDTLIEVYQGDFSFGMEDGFAGWRTKATVFEGELPVHTIELEFADEPKLGDVKTQCVRKWKQWREQTGRPEAS